MKKSTLIILLVLVALAASATWFFVLRKNEKKIALTTEKPQTGYISQSVTATGTIEPVDTVTVGTQVSGTIKFIYADFNSKVKKGQLIAELDKSLLDAQVNQYKANLEVAKSELTYQDGNFNRQNSLFKVGAISRADYETALNQYNTAKATVGSVQAQLDAADKNLSYASIYSPVDGVVLTRNISIGQTVASSFSTPTLFIIAKDITKMQVQAAVDEADIGNVTIGQRVTFTVDAFPDDLFNGTVEEIRLQPTVSSNVVTYTTIISAPNQDLKLKPGMTANIIIYTREVNNALLISAKALKYIPDSSISGQYEVLLLSPDSLDHSQNSNHANRIHNPDSAGKKRVDSLNSKIAFVWLLEGDSVVQRRIRIGLNDDTHVQVLHGLSAEDNVINGEEDASHTPAASGAQRSPFLPRRPSSTPATRRPGT